MRNLIILGTGRSGTSMVAALLRDEPGIFYGYQLLGATPANPYGYFEDEVVNAVNNLLIKRMVGASFLDVLPEYIARRLERGFPPMHVDTRALWLASPRRPWRWRLGWELGHLLRMMGKRNPFCLKDPRFSFTLPLWREYFPDDTRFLVVYRDPACTVESFLRDARESYAPPLPMTEAWAWDHWELAYRRILQHRAGGGEWMTVNYDRVAGGQALPAMAAFTESSLDASAIHTEVSRAHGNPNGATAIPERCRRLYEELEQQCLADLQRWGAHTRSRCYKDEARTP